jgi:hypothetical protein
MNQPSPRDSFLNTIDFSFSRMLVPRLIRWVYAIGMVVVTISWLVWIFNGPLHRAAATLAALVGWPLSIVLVRVYCEVMMVIFKINDRLGEIAEDLRTRPEAAR